MDLSVSEMEAPAVARQTERAEANAWIDLYGAAPEEVAREQGLRLARVGEVAVLSAARLRSPLVNRALGLGLGEPATPGLVDRVLGLLQEGTGDRAAPFLVQVVPAAQPAELAGWLRERGLQPAVAEERLRRGGAPLPDLADGSKAEIEKVTGAAAVGEWTGLVDRTHGPGVGAWLAPLVGRPGWFHSLARRYGRAVASLSMYVHHDGMAWLGLGAASVGAGPAAAEAAPLVHALVRAGLQAGADTFVAAAPPDGSADAFTAAGFERLYARQGWGPA